MLSCGYAHANTKKLEKGSKEEHGGKGTPKSLVAAVISLFKCSHCQETGQVMPFLNRVLNLEKILKAQHFTPLLRCASGHPFIFHSVFSEILHSREYIAFKSCTHACLLSHYHSLKSIKSLWTAIPHVHPTIR